LLTKNELVKTSEKIIIKIPALLGEKVTTSSCKCKW